MKISLTLGQKALILVVLPLSFEVVFLMTLWYMIQQSLLQSQEKEHSRVMIAQADTAIRQVADAAGSLGAFHFSHNQEFLRRYAERVQLAHDAMNLLHKTARSDNKREQETLKRFDTVANEIFSCMDESKALLEGGESQSTQQIRIMNAIPQLRKTFDELVDHQLLIHPDILKESQSSNMRLQAIMTAIVLGILGNIAIAVSLTIYFNTGTTQRLKQLMTNTVLLAKHEEIMPCLEGSDEIAQLDGFFHRMANQLREIEKLKEELMAMVSHDLRTPISSTLAFVDMLLEGAYKAPSKECDAAAVRVQASMKRLLMLVNDLLDLEKIQSGRFSLTLSDTNLKRIIGRSLDSMEGTAQAAQVTIDTSDISDVPLHADEDRLVQVVVNLVANAVKFSPKDGTVFVSGTMHDKAAKLSVRDQGPGVPDVLRDKIFEPFEQGATKQAKGGFGLGLAICKKIVDAHHGRIFVEPAKEGGSVFIVELPTDSQS